MKAFASKPILKVLTGIALISICMIALLWNALQHSPPPQPRISKAMINPEPGKPITAASVTEKSADAFSIATQRGARLGPPPASLSGTDVDGSLKTDDQGNLIIDIGLRQLFDYFLSTIGEEPLSDIRARIAFHLAQQLNPTAAQQAWQTFENYLNYKQQLDNLTEHDGTVQGMQESLKQQQDLRIAILGPELASAFFREEDDFTNFSLGQLEISRNPDLTAIEKEQSINELLATLPEQSRARIQPQSNPLAIEEKVIQQQKEGATESEIWQFREQQLGAAAADRLALLDQQRQHWDQQYSEYRMQYRTILQSGMSDIDSRQAIENLRLQYFNPEELKRVQVLDQQPEPGGG